MGGGFWKQQFFSPSPLDFALQRRGGKRLAKPTEVLPVSPGCASGSSPHLGSTKESPEKDFSAASALRGATGSISRFEWGLGVMAQATSSVAMRN